MTVWIVMARAHREFIAVYETYGDIPTRYTERGITIPSDYVVEEVEVKQ